MKLTTLAAAAALIAGGVNPAYAATVGDTDADGSSDVIFMMLNPNNNETFIWDLSLPGSDLQTADFYTNEPGPTGTIPDQFTLQNAELNAFIAAAGSDFGTLRWRVVGLGLDNTADPIRNFGALVTSSSVPGSNNPGQTFQVTAFNTLLNNVGSLGLDADGVAGTADDSAVFAAGSIVSWNTLAEGAAFSNQAKTGFEGPGLNMYWVHRAKTGAINVAGSIDVDTAGYFNLQWDADAGVATLGYAVPVPAAVWLFGSALAGLAGIKRRKA